MEGMQYRGGDGSREVHSEERETEVRARRTCGRGTMDPECGHKIRGRVQVRVQYVEAVCMRAGTEVTVCRRGSAGAVRGVRGRGSEAEGIKVQTTPKVGYRRYLVDHQWKIRGDARAGWRCKSENEGACAPGITSSVQWSRSAECGHRGSVSTSAGGRETPISPIAIENREPMKGKRVGVAMISHPRFTATAAPGFRLDFEDKPPVLRVHILSAETYDSVGGHLIFLLCFTRFCGLLGSRSPQYVWVQLNPGSETPVIVKWTLLWWQRMWGWLHSTHTHARPSFQPSAPNLILTVRPPADLAVLAVDFVPILPTLFLSFNSLTATAPLEQKSHIHTNKSARVFAARDMLEKVYMSHVALGLLTLPRPSALPATIIGELSIGVLLFSRSYGSEVMERNIYVDDTKKAEVRKNILGNDSSIEYSPPITFQSSGFIRSFDSTPG
ncbi:hypothetical protein B0H13DRAFT_1903621 [Mycena leptocephala]|nr:hypothetical protein B0H13DRAFT_1903621 [Mycena leptocephala]